MSSKDDKSFEVYLKIKYLACTSKDLEQIALDQSKAKVNFAMKNSNPAKSLGSWAKYTFCTKSFSLYIEIDTLCTFVTEFIAFFKTVRISLTEMG